jgi:hypothetical protein
MAAADHLHPVQLRMFMTARELYNTPSIDVQRTPESRFGGHWKTMDAMWATKRKENKADKLDKHVAQHGVFGPVTLGIGGRDLGEIPHIVQGHHRIVAAYDANPESYVPVEHEDFGARKHEFRSSTGADEDWQRRQEAPASTGWKPVNRFPSYP